MVRIGTEIEVDLEYADADRRRDMVDIPESSTKTSPVALRLEHEVESAAPNMILRHIVPEYAVAGTRSKLNLYQRVGTHTDK